MLMSLIGAMRLYFSLSTEQKAFIKNGGGQASMSVHKWVRFLEPMCQFDQLRDNARKGSEEVTVAFVFLSFASIFPSIIMESYVPSIIVVSLFILVRIPLSILKRRDINNNVRNTLYPLLNLLSLEIGNKQKIDISVCARKNLEKEDIIETERSDDNNTFYCYDMLELNCTLKDKTKLTWKVRDIVRRREKVNLRGKRKIKRKLKRRVLVSMSFRKDLYRLNPSASKELEGNIKDGNDKITYKHTLKYADYGSTKDIDIEELLDTSRAPYKYMMQVKPRK